MTPDKDGFIVTGTMTESRRVDLFKKAFIEQGWKVESITTGEAVPGVCDKMFSVIKVKVKLEDIEVFAAVCSNTLAAARRRERKNK